MPVKITFSHLQKKSECYIILYERCNNYTIFALNQGKEQKNP